ncbi:MAG: twin-arginine translocase TatA/TatE family subunit [Archaeoglobaceae archaeon]|nr:twin-arginine translocase TatA/TatE family subunit [Archaeoglobaceae archaeon]MDW7989049.1 twin-arginine translocase TatA/TatE family subunit [Archaeoglobaceae archaeon]
MLGFEEIIFIAILALVILTPEKLTEFAREVGKIYAEYKKAKRMIELEVLYGIPSDEKLREEMEKKFKELEIEVEKFKVSKYPPH